MSGKNRLQNAYEIFVAVLFLGPVSTVHAFDVDAAKAFHQEVAGQQDDVRCLQASDLQACIRLSKKSDSFEAQTQEKLREIIKTRPTISGLESAIEQRVFVFSSDDQKLAEDTLQGLYRAEGKSRKKSAYFFKSYKLANNQSDFKEMIAHANADELLSYHEGAFSKSAEFKQSSLNKLRAANDPKSAFHAYLISKEQADFNRALSAVRTADSSTANKILGEKFRSSVKSVAQLPDFFSGLASCTQCDLPHFYSLSKSLADFGKNLTFEDFLNSIEYRHVLRHEPIKVGFARDGSGFVMKISYAGGELQKSFSAKCQSRGTESRTESVGFLEGIFVPSATKTVVYEMSDCHPRVEEMQRLANLERALTGTVKSSRAFEGQGTWSHRVAISSTYDRASSSGSSAGGGSGGLGNACTSISDMSLKTYCTTGDCNSLGFNYPELQALCMYKNTSSLYKTKLHVAIQDYINYGQCDTFKLREKAHLSQSNVNSFCRVKDSPSLRTMMVIMWLNGISFRY